MLRTMFSPPSQFSPLDTPFTMTHIMQFHTFAHHNQSNMALLLLNSRGGYITILLGEKTSNHGGATI